MDRLDDSPTLGRISLLEHRSANLEPRCIMSSQCHAIARLVEGVVGVVQVEELVDLLNCT